MSAEIDKNFDVLMNLRVFKRVAYNFRTLMEASRKQSGVEASASFAGELKLNYVDSCCVQSS